MVMFLRRILPSHVRPTNSVILFTMPCLGIFVRGDGLKDIGPKRRTPNGHSLAWNNTVTKPGRYVRLRRVSLSVYPSCIRWGLVSRRCALCCVVSVSVRQSCAGRVNVEIPVEWEHNCCASNGCDHRSIQQRFACQFFLCRPGDLAQTAE